MAYWPSKRPSKVTKPKFQLIRNLKRPTFIDVHIQSYLYSTCLIYIYITVLYVVEPSNKLGYQRIRRTICKNLSRDIAVLACDSSWGSLFYHWIIQPTLMVICWWFMIGNLAINGAPQKPMIYHYFPIVNDYTGGYIPFSDTPMGITVWSHPDCVWNPLQTSSVLILLTWLTSYPMLCMKLVIGIEPLDSSHQTWQWPIKNCWFYSDVKLPEGIVYCVPI